MFTESTRLPPSSLQSGGQYWTITFGGGYTALKCPRARLALRPPWRRILLWRTSPFRLFSAGRCCSLKTTINSQRSTLFFFFLSPFESYVRAWGGNKLEVMSHNVRKTHWRRYYAQLSFSFALIADAQSSENAELIGFASD